MFLAMISDKFCECLRNRRAQSQYFARLRMDEFQTVGVQEHPRTGVFTQLFVQFKITVFVIADNRMLDRRAVYVWCVRPVKIFTRTAV